MSRKTLDAEPAPHSRLSYASHISTILPSARRKITIWVGVDKWSAHEREAVGLGVRATLLSVLASDDVTVLEFDVTNPDALPDRCPPDATFVHHLRDGRPRRLRIHYPDHVTAHGIDLRTPP